MFAARPGIAAAHRGIPAGTADKQKRISQGEISMAIIDGDDTANTLAGTASDDTINGFGGADLLIGNDGNDILNGGTGGDLLRGGIGADTLNGGDGIDTVEYAGTDAVNVTIGGIGAGGEAQGDAVGVDIENIDGTDGGDDHLTGSAAANQLSGFAGADLLRGLAGNDTLDGGAGQDFLVGGAGADVLFGGAGDDTVDYSDSTAGVDVIIGAVSWGGDAQDDLVGMDIESVQGSLAHDDLLAGSAAANMLTGFGGDDILLGYAGDDTLSGGDGDDHLEGGAGADTLNGGDGIDTVRYVDSMAGVTVDLTTLTASGGDAEGDVFGAGADLEILIGSADFSDTLTGSALANTLRGFGGDDVLRGGWGADRLDGGAGIDTLSYYTSGTGVQVSLAGALGSGSGGEAQGDTLVDIEIVSGSQGNDSLYGNPDPNVLQGWNGNDILIGRYGKDTLTGGAGADRFRYDATWESKFGETADRITDFSHAQGDRIDLSAIDADTGAAGNQAFSFIGTGLYTHTAGQLRYHSDGVVTTVAGDVNGDGVSDFHIQLSGAIGLVAGDFML
jgi:Ca2+-binding RTX toxin-like protein